MSGFGLLGWLLLASVGGDMATTQYALSRPGFRELNPLMQSQIVRLSLPPATAAALHIWTGRMHRRGQTKKALAIRIAAVGIFGYVTAHNLREIRSR